VGDEKAQASASYSYSAVVADVGTDFIWQKRKENNGTQTYKFDIAHIWKDRWQAGLSVPIVNKQHASESTTGLGDITTTLGYEYLTDWDYNPWRPRGFGFLQLFAPTGRSIYESETTYQSDVRGKGLWAIGLGTILTKTYGPYDGFLNLDIHRSFSRSFSNATSSGVLNPGTGGNVGFGLGYNLAAYRFGGGITWNYEDAIDVEGSTPSRGSAQRYASANATVSYLWDKHWAATLSYVDQTLFGNPTNTSLSRSGVVFLQRKWPR
jgi:hypothetical protein